MTGHIKFDQTLKGNTMNVKDSVVLITGANRGLGLELAKAVLAAGARKVYAAVRDPASVTLPGLVPLKLDVTSAADIAAVVAAAADVTILVNNAGISRGANVTGADAADHVRAELETNFLAPMALSNAYAPVLGRNGGGAIVNVLSVLSWLSMERSTTYSVSKAAAWSWTNGLRNELRAQNTQVLAAHMGLMDTDMTKRLDAPKAQPADIAKAIIDALQDGQDEVLTDDTSRQVKQGMTAPRPVYLGAPRA
jgi:NAD(P)-dependent dehydrogenase (short-subunit alcohol dehydrogenase family)